MEIKAEFLNESFTKKCVINLRFQIYYDDARGYG